MNVYEVYMNSIDSSQVDYALEAASIQTIREKILSIIRWVREKLDELSRLIRRKSDIYIPKYAYDTIEQLKTTRINMMLNEIAKAAHVADFPIISKILDNLEMKMPKFDITRLQIEYQKKKGDFIRIRVQEVQSLIHFYNNVIYITERVVKNLMDQYVVDHLGQNPTELASRLVTIIATKGAKRAIRFLNICITQGRIKAREIAEIEDIQRRVKKEAREEEKRTMKEIRQAGQKEKIKSE